MPLWLNITLGVINTIPSVLNIAGRLFKRKAKRVAKEEIEKKNRKQADDAKN